MIKKILNNWYDKSFFIARVTIYITLTFVYISLILFPIPIDPNHYCGLCGMTSAVNCLLHFKFIEAYNYNPKVLLILFLIIFIIIDIVLFIIKKNTYIKYYIF